jgi:hypothetical protein
VLERRAEQDATSERRLSAGNKVVEQSEYPVGQSATFISRQQVVHDKQSSVIVLNEQLLVNRTNTDTTNVTADDLSQLREPSLLATKAFIGGDWAEAQDKSIFEVHGEHQTDILV